MKKILSATLLCLTAMSASAILNGDGYYRVQNAKTERYIYVLDDKGSLNFQATTAELGAIELWKGFDKAVSDPATIIYVKDLNGKQQDYDLQAQGTGVHAIINYPVSIRLANKNTGEYSIFGRNSGLTRYIGDGTRSSAARGYVTSLENGEYYRWYFHPITNDDANYFGVSPEFEDGGVYYTTLYADFPFTFHSPGMKAYYVNTVAEGKAFLTEVEGAVAPGTPVIITTTAATSDKNRLNIGGTASKIDGNQLKGVYFCNNDILHKNQEAFDKKTMRVLGKLADGSVGFVSADIAYVPRNKAYIVVPENSPEEFSLTTETYTGGIIDVYSDAGLSVRANGQVLYIRGVESADVFNITGARVAHVADAANGATCPVPSTGLYLVKSGNTVAKILVK